MFLTNTTQIRFRRMGELLALHQEMQFTPASKSMILNEPLDKIINITLANTEPITDKPQESLCAKTLQTKSKNTKIQSTQLTQSNSNNKEDLKIDSNVIAITMKYFKIWQIKVKEKRYDKDRIDKIENFLKQLRKQKQIKTLNSKHENESNNTNHSTCNIKYKDIYKSRHKAQQNLIKAQKIKLQEQERVIESLKIGIIVDEAQKCLENSKYEIRNVFKRCSEQVKCKITPLQAVKNDANAIEIKTSKVPKIVCQMEKRAMERAIRRSIILEKKKLMEEKKRKDIENAVAQKKAVDEEQRQRNLELIKERRKIEAELEKRRQENKKEYLGNLNKANRFYKKKILRRFFNTFKILVEIKMEFEAKSEMFYKSLLKKKCINNWKIYVRNKIERESFEANCLYNYKLMRNIWKAWRSVLVLQKQSMQVAEDLHDMKIQSKAFIYWHRYVCKQHMIEIKNLSIAEKHYNSRILLQYFYQWKSLPAVIQLEKAKEQKKRKWREKVWEIIPDYQPYVEII